MFFQGNKIDLDGLLNKFESELVSLKDEIGNIRGLYLLKLIRAYLSFIEQVIGDFLVTQGDKLPVRYQNKILDLLALINELRDDVQDKLLSDDCVLDLDLSNIHSQVISS